MNLSICSAFFKRVAKVEIIFELPKIYFNFFYIFSNFHSKRA